MIGEIVYALVVFALGFGVAVLLLATEDSRRE